MFMESINFTAFTVEHGDDILGQQGSTAEVWQGSTGPGIRVYIQVPLPLLPPQLGGSQTLNQVPVIPVSLALCKHGPVEPHDSYMSLGQLP